MHLALSFYFHFLMINPGLETDLHKSIQSESAQDVT